MADHIEHVVVLMLENRSFDHMLGCMQGVYAGLDGIAPAAPPRTNPDANGNPIPQAPNVKRIVNPGCMHEHANVMVQIANDSCGYVADYYQSFPRSTSDQWEQVMGYYPIDALPALHTLARNFAICDHWFSSMPGPTWPNRFFVHSGTCLGHVLMPSGVFDKNIHYYDQPTVYVRLEEQHVSWKIYHHGMPQTLVMTRQLEYLDHYSGMDQFFRDVAGPASRFPQYSFIEPCYTGAAENDQHPPADIINGEALIAEVYNALRSNDSLWKSTLLVLLYDEHGGFYDHVTPLPTVAPDEYTTEYSFAQYGVRVPAILISPWVRKGVVSTVFDHTSLLRYASDKWKLGALGERTRRANSFAAELETLDAARDDTPQSITAPATVVVPTEAQPTDAHQNAMVAFGRYLETQLDHTGMEREVVNRMQREHESAEAAIQVARERFENLFRRGFRGQ